MTRRKILLALITQDNDYQREQALVAESTAKRLDVELQVVYANSDAITQTQQILTAIRMPADRPDAVVVAPVGTGMLNVAKSAAMAGVGWIVLNREADYLKPMRESSTAPIGSISCDNVEVGRIQGRQFAALLPSGGAVLYIEGPLTEVSKQRRAGMEETLPSNIEIKLIRGRWTEESAFLAINPWLQLESKRQSNVGVIGCQNDAMAMGARRAVEQLSDAAVRERLLKMSFTGVDGVRETGQAWVQKGLLAATVVTPALTGLAIEMLVQAFANGQQLPERTLTKPTSFPVVEKIGARKD
jgi:ABC-type sugar transport system substrate-binding protein